MSLKFIVKIDRFAGGDGVLGNEKLVAGFNDAIGEYRPPIGFLTEIPSATKMALAVAEEYAANLVSEARDAIDISRLSDINTALVDNGSVPADKLDDVDKRIPQVRAAGYNHGYGDGYSSGREEGEIFGFHAGEMSEYNRFWETYQRKGASSISYDGAFSGEGWTTETFAPKYNIVPSSAQNMFWHSGITDLMGALEKSGVSLDFSRCVSFSSTFANAKIEEIGDVSAIGRSLSMTFANTSYLHTIEKIIVSESTTYSSAFRKATALANVTFDGVIGQSGLDFQWSTLLSRASIENIIGALSSTASGKSITLSTAAVNAAFEDEPGLQNGSGSMSWALLIATKPNWTISLV